MDTQRAAQASGNAVDALPAALRACRWLGDPDRSSVPAERFGAELTGALPLLVAQGLAPLAAARAARIGWIGVDAATRARLEAARTALIARELVLADACGAALAALAAAGVPALVIKGQALAAQVYDEAATRERVDVDLWVDADGFDTAVATLARAGLRAQLAADGVWSLPERSFTAPAGGSIDLHRRLVSQPLLQRALPFDAAWERAHAFARGPARVPEPADALLIAGLHAVAHHGPDLRWNWVLDAHRLVLSDPGCVARAAARAQRSGTAAILAHLLRRSVELYATPVDAKLLDELAAAAATERSARLLRPMSPLARAWFDWRSLPGASARTIQLVETLFPRRDYMRAKYPEAPRWALPWLYVKRAVGGLVRAWRA